MNERDHLERKLTKLATETSVIEDGWRRIGDAKSDILAAVVTEIEETFFPCILTLRNAAGDVLSIAVSNRRLSRILSPLPSAVGTQEPLCGVDLVDPGEDVLERLSELFRGHADGSHLWVRTTDAGDAYEGIGVPARLLARAWGIGADARSETEIAEAFLEFANKLKSRSQFWVTMTDDTVSGTSDAAPVDAFLAAAAYGTKLVSSVSADGVTSPAFLEFGSRGARSYAAAILGRNRVIASIEGDSLNALATEWRLAGF